MNFAGYTANQVTGVLQDILDLQEDVIAGALDIAGFISRADHKGPAQRIGFTGGCHFGGIKYSWFYRCVSFLPKVTHYR
jgi:hypothetical protein